MDCLLKRLPEILGRRYKKKDSLQLFPDGPRGASDHKKVLKNENFRRFAIGTMLLVSLGVGLSGKSTPAVLWPSMPQRGRNPNNIDETVI